MGVVRVGYVCLHAIVTIMFQLHLMWKELIDRLMPSFRKIATYRRHSVVDDFVAETSVKNCEYYAALCDAGRKLNELKKLPTHVVCIFAEHIVHIDRIINIIQWCSLTGISCISLCDLEGVLLRNKDVIETGLHKAARASLNGLKCKHFVIHQGFTPQEPSTSVNTINVHIISQLDGRHRFAQIARFLASNYSSSEIKQDIVEECMGKFLPGDPELMLQFGDLHCNTTLGYSPWHLRLTQMLRVPSHTTVRPDHISSSLLTYGSCQQRYGK